MRAREILNEKIANGARNLNTYLTLRIKELDGIIARVQPAIAVIKADKGEGDYVLRYALGVANGGDRPQLPSDYEVDLIRHYELESLRSNLEAILKYGANDFLKYAFSTLEHVHPVSEETRHVLSLMPHVDAGFAEYGFAPNDDDDEYRAAKALATAFTTIGTCLTKVEALLSGLKLVINDIAKRQRYNIDPHLYRPDHDDVETLYHASLYTGQIVKSGFAAEKPEERAGLGNYGEQAGISFTHDIKVAYDILRAFREVWMIVHGEVTRAQIIGWMKAEGIDPKQAASLFVTSKDPLDSPEQVVRLYRGYLGYSKLRTDPVMTSPDRLAPLMRQIVYKDIGIISCPVKLDGKEEYLHGEAEFRVPADRIVGPIKRVI